MRYLTFFLHMESLEPSVYYTYSRAHFGLTTYLKAHGANGYCVIHVGYFTYPHGSHLLPPLHFPLEHGVREEKPN